MERHSGQRSPEIRGAGIPRVASSAGAGCLQRPDPAAALAPEASPPSAPYHVRTDALPADERRPRLQLLRGKLRVAVLQRILAAIA